MTKKQCACDEYGYCGEHRPRKATKLRGKKDDYFPKADVAYELAKCPRNHWLGWFVAMLLMTLALYQRLVLIHPTVPVIVHHKVRHYSEEVKKLPPIEKPVFYIKKEEPSPLPPDDMSGSIPNGGVPVTKTPEPLPETGGCPAGSEMHGGACAKY